jgi:hypothetical protein
MKLEILSGVIISAESVEAGSFVEADKALADLLIGSNKAILAPEEVPAEAPKKGRKPTPQSPEEATP